MVIVYYCYPYYESTDSVVVPAICSKDNNDEVFESTFHFESEETALKFIRDVNYNMAGLVIEGL